MGSIREKRQIAAIGGSMVKSAVKIGCTAAVMGALAGVMPVSFNSQCGLIAPAYADDSASKTVSLDIEAADLHQVVHMLQQQTGVSIVIRDEGQTFGKVNVTLNHTPLEAALKYIALSANAKVTRDEDGVYVIEPNTGSSTVADSGQAPQTTTASADTGDYHWLKLSLQHATPKDVLYLMHWDQDYREIAAPSALTFPAAGASMSNYPVIYNYPSQGPSVPAGSGTTGQAGVNYASGEAAGRSVEPGSPDTAQQFPGGAGGYPGGYPGGAAYPGAGAFNPQQFNPGQIPGQAGQPGRGAANALPDGVKKIYALQSDNSLLVQATPDGFQRVKEIVKNLDIAPRQVQIKVEFVTALVSTVDQEGINWSIIPYPGVSIVPTLSQPSQPSISIQYATGNAAVSLLADLERDHSKVVQSPIITTTNNVQATVQVNTQIPYTTDSTILGGNNNNNITTTTQQFLNITTGLTVQPRINSDDTVTLQLSPQVSTPGTNTSSSTGPPPVTTQSLTTLRTIRSGDTMVLGGLIAKTDERIQKRIPILADLPIIGSLFRDRNIQISDSELLIFVTPTIIAEDMSVNGSSVTP